MTISQFFSFLSSFSFFVCFASVFIYWIQAAFISSPVLRAKSEKHKTGKEQNKTKAKVQKKTLLDKSQNWGTFTMLLSNISMFLLLVLRWKESGHFPLSNLYESLIFLSWTCTLFHLFLENYTQSQFVGCITAPSALFTNAFATFSLPLEMQQSSALVPALQSNWLMMHVTVMILSYAALICGSLLSIAFLIVTKDFKFSNDRNVFSTFFAIPVSASFDSKGILESNSTGFVLQNNLTNKQNLSINEVYEQSSQTSQASVLGEKKEKLAETLDNLSYRILGIGFPFLTIGILSGAVWANEAWGSYWSWDPKETWAFLTWLVFAIYLHTRLTKGWQGQKPALIASLGFFTVWLCFLGVNLLGEGLHSYGFLNKI